MAFSTGFNISTLIPIRKNSCKGVQEAQEKMRAFEGGSLRGDHKRGEKQEKPTEFERAQSMSNGQWRPEGRRQSLEGWQEEEKEMRGIGFVDVRKEFT